MVSTHLHNLELVKQGETAKLPDAEQMSNDAAKAEEMLAELEADNELAGSVGAITNSGLSAEEQALFEELEREAAGDKAKGKTGASVEAEEDVPATPKIKLDHAERPEALADAEEREPAQPAQPAQPARPQQRRPEPEAG